MQTRSFSYAAFNVPKTHARGYAGLCWRHEISHLLQADIQPWLPVQAPRVPRQTQTRPAWWWAERTHQQGRQQWPFRRCLGNDRLFAVVDVLLLVRSNINVHVNMHV